MLKVDRLLYYPRHLLLSFANRGLIHISDERYIRLLFKDRFGIKIDLENPISFNEKIQWLKLHDRKKAYVTMVDKYLVKDYVANIIGEEHIIPTLGVWDSFDQIDFESLPNQFVLKCTHDSGSVVIVKDKAKMDIKKCKRIISKSLKRDYYLLGREWVYKNVERKVIAEKYMKESDNDADLTDYKFYCFNGIPMYCQVITNRTIDERIDFFDMNWNHMEFTGLAKPYKRFSDTEIHEPLNFKKMKEYCSLLAKDIPFLRVDFYEINQQIFFGELTFFPADGVGEFYPSEWNIKLGNMIDISKVK